jgi:signal peptidase
MKRAILLFFLIAIVVVGIYSVKEWMPIMAIAGDSMKPELKRGDTILIGQVSPSEVEVGDIIVFKVHPLIQENYRYPATVAHRVIELTTFQGGLAFKTKGDNTAEDPFVVPASDLRGEVSGSVPYLGYLLLFLQSRQGMIFAIIALILLGFDLYADELGQGKRRLQRAVFAPILEQNQELARRQEQSLEMSSKAMEQFASAISEYAQHLASHTDAVKSMAAASQELRDAVREQNKMFKSWQHIGGEEGGEEGADGSRGA